MLGSDAGQSLQTTILIARFPPPAKYPQDLDIDAAPQPAHNVRGSGNSERQKITASVQQHREAECTARRPRKMRACAPQILRRK
jgi:hypothetical protein